MELSVDDVLARQRDTRTTTSAARTDDVVEAKPLSFDEIIKLVESGQTEDIPNNETISTDLHVRSTSECRDSR